MTQLSEQDKQEERKPLQPKLISRLKAENEELMKEMQGYKNESQHQNSKIEELKRINEALRENFPKVVSTEGRIDQLIIERDEYRTQAEEYRQALKQERYDGRVEWERFRLQDKDEIARLKAERERVIELLRDATGYNATGYPFPDKLKKEIAVVLSKPGTKRRPT